jgi:hypothetical protein
VILHIIFVLNHNVNTILTLGIRQLIVGDSPYIIATNNLRY